MNPDEDYSYLSPSNFHQILEKDEHDSSFISQKLSEFEEIEAKILQKSQEIKTSKELEDKGKILQKITSPTKLMTKFVQDLTSFVFEAQDPSQVRGIYEKYKKMSFSIDGLFELSGVKTQFQEQTQTSQEPRHTLAILTEDHKESNESQGHDPILVEYEVDLSHVFKHPLSNIEDALEKLNFEAAKVNQYFKKGSNTINKYSAKYYYLRCSKYQTLLKDNSKKSQNSCKAYYSFTEITRTDSTGQKEILVELSKSIQTHNHHPLILNKLNEQMEEDIKFFSRRTKIVDIQKFLETKYGKTLNYQQIYFFFRKIHPLFGPKDCQFFINYLSKKKVFYRFISHSNGQRLCKLYFATESIRKNYSNYHDIILLDATYSLNKYQIPVVIFSGIAADSINIIFGIALVNDETLETYNWVLKQFFESHGEIFPTVLVSDQDRAICSAMDKYKNHFDHFLCQWHLIRNLQRKFSFLKINHKDIYNSALKLPYILEKKSLPKHKKS